MREYERAINKLRKSENALKEEMAVLANNQKIKKEMQITKLFEIEVSPTQS